MSNVGVLGSAVVASGWRMGASFQEDIASVADPAATTFVSLDGTTNDGAATRILWTRNGVQTPDHSSPGSVSTEPLNHDGLMLRVATSGWNGSITTADQVGAGFLWWPGAEALSGELVGTFWYYGGWDIGLTLGPNGVGCRPGGAWLDVPAGWFGYLLRQVNDQDWQLDVWDGSDWQTSIGTSPAAFPQEGSAASAFLTGYEPAADCPLHSAGQVIVGGYWGDERTDLSEFRPVVEAWYA